MGKVIIWIIFVLTFVVLVVSTKQISNDSCIAGKEVYCSTEELAKLCEKESVCTWFAFHNAWFDRVNATPPCDGPMRNYCATPELAKRCDRLTVCLYYWGVNPWEKGPCPKGWESDCLDLHKFW